MHVWDEFSEFLPQNRVPTSADFNTYPIRIFIFGSVCHLTIYIASRSRSWINDEKRSIKKFFIAKL